MRKDRLLKLADFLETVPRKAFDIGDWQSKPPTKPEGKRQGECGFAGCAVGWAVHAKLFRGLTFVQDRYSFINALTPHYQGVTGYAAATKLFDIEGDYETSDTFAGKAEYLFSPVEYNGNPTPKQVAKRIRKFVAEHSKPRAAVLP